jgi:hypothetical protein
MPLRPLPESVESSKASAEPQRINAMTLPALVVGLLCVAITCVMVCYAELVVGKIQIGFLQLPPVVVGMLVLLLGAQAVLKRFSARLQLKPHEMFTVYVMMLLAAMVSSRGLLQKLIPLLIVPNYFATSENGWKDKFFKNIPHWAVPWDPNGDAKQDVAKHFYEHLPPGAHIPWQLWIVPLLAWGVFVALMFTAFLCLAVILRRQWVDNEKLSFPLVQLPLEMVKGENTSSIGGRSALGGEGFLKNRLTWFGFALPALVFGMKGLHQYMPTVPDVLTDLSLNDFFQQPPYNQMGFFHLYGSFAAVGFFYLLPTDLLFSLWFFFLLSLLEDVLAASAGYQPEVMPMYGCKLYQGYQLIGCYVVLVGYMIYTARPHLKRVWRAAFNFRREEEKKGRREDTGEDEILSYKTAFWGLIVCLLLMAGWMTILGMSYWLALCEIAVLLFVIALVMARSTCESGMLMTETSFRPIDIYRMIGDPRNLGGANLTGLAFLDGLWMRDQRGLVLTGFLDSMKFADGVRVRRRSLLGVFAIALVVALGISGYLHISLPYRLGAVQMYGYVYQANPVWAFNEANTQLTHTGTPLPFFATINFFIGGLITVLLATLRTRLLWFPLHPLGYALSGTWTMMVFWFPCMVAWLLKVLMLRYGGMKLYARARPFFLGMVLGEFTTAIFFTLPALYDRYTPTPTFPWP